MHIHNILYTSRNDFVGMLPLHIVGTMSDDNDAFVFTCEAKFAVSAPEKTASSVFLGNVLRFSGWYVLFLAPVFLPRQAATV